MSEANNNVQTATKRSLDDLALEMAQGEHEEKLERVIANLDTEEQNLEEKLRQVRLKRRLAVAGPEIAEMIEKAEQIQRRVIEGDRWATNSGGRVEKKLDELGGKIKKAEAALTQLRETHDLLSSDNGKTYGERMRAAAEQELLELRPKIEEKLESQEIDIDLDEVLDAVK